NPPPGAGTAAFSVNIVSPDLKVTTFFPKMAAAGSNSVEIQIMGAGFDAATRVTVDGAAIETRFVNAAEVRGTLGSALLQRPRNVRIGVVNPAPGGGGVEAGIFAILDVPVISAVSPGRGVAGTSVSVTLSGANFIDGSTIVSVNGAGVGVGPVSVSSPST